MGWGQLLAELCLQNGQLLIFSLEAEQMERSERNQVSLNRKTHPPACVWYSGPRGRQRRAGGCTPGAARGSVLPPGVHQPAPGKDLGEGAISDMEKIWGKADGKPHHQQLSRETPRLWGAQ